MIFYNEAFDEGVCSVEWCFIMKKKGTETDIFDGEESASTRREEISVNCHIVEVELYPIHGDIFDVDGQQEDIDPISNIGLNVENENGDVAENVAVDGKVILPNNKKWVWGGIKNR